MTKIAVKLAANYEMTPKFFKRRTAPIRTALVIMLTGFCLSACDSVSQNTASPLSESDVQNAEPSFALSLEDVLRDPRRAEEAPRDIYRHPKATLEFFELGPDKAVAEIWPGWYTNILAPYLASNGGTYSAVLLPDSLGERYADRNASFKDKYSDMSVYGDIQYGTYFSNVDEILPPDSQDIILTFRNVHNWMARDFADHAFQSFYAALKPGGILGVVEHRLPETDVQDPKARSGYVQESYMKDMAKRAGFEFIAASEINANPKDDADHPRGVWTLPPRLRAPDEDHPEAQNYDPQIYRDIGESDRATLKFRKPL